MFNTILSFLIEGISGCFSWFDSIITGIGGSWSFLFSFISMFLVFKFILSPLISRLGSGSDRASKSRSSSKDYTRSV